MTAIDLPTVPALPADLEPVAVAGADVPAGAWGVVAVTDGHPDLLFVDVRNHPAARDFAGEVATAWHTEEVYVIQRTSTAVLVNTRHTTKGHLLGVYPAAGESYQVSDNRAWDHVLRVFPRDPQRAHEHMRNIAEAWRAAHNLADDVAYEDIIVAVNDRPLPGRVYLDAYVALMADPARLHMHALVRAIPMHRRPAED